MQRQYRLAQTPAVEVEAAPQPDRVAVPLGPHDRARRALAAEARRPLRPRRVVEARLRPARGRRVGRVTPHHRALARRRLDHRRHRQRLADPRRLRGHPRGRELELRAVVGQQAVALDLHVAGLRVHRRREARGAQLAQLADEVGVGGLVHVAPRVAPVAPVLLGLPQVARHDEAEPAEFAAGRGPVRLQLRAARRGVGVDVVHVARAMVGPPARVVHQPRGVQLLHPARDRGRVVLAPALVERHPHDDARVVPVRLDHRLQLAAEERGRLRRVRRIPLPVAHVSARHVLPHHQPQPVAPVVPARRLHLHVLARQVEAHRLRRLDVVAQRLVRRRRVEPVRPPALVQRPVLEQRAVVQEQPVDAGLVFPHLDLAQPRVALHHVVAEPHLEVIEVRRVGRPRLRRGQLQQQLATRRPRRLRHRLPTVEHAHRCLARALHRHAERGGVEVGHDHEARDVGRGHLLEPRRLPDAADRGVHDAARLQHLLAARLRAAVGCVVHAHGDLLRAGRPQRVGDVERERVIAAAVLADRLAVHPHSRLPVDRAEVQQHAVAGARGDLERAAVPQVLVGRQRLRDAAQRRLEREGDEDLALELRGPRCVARDDGVVPQAVQRLPVRALQLRPRVLRQRRGRVDLRGPAGADAISRGRPREGEEEQGGQRGRHPASHGGSPVSSRHTPPASRREAETPHRGPGDGATPPRPEWA